MNKEIKEGFLQGLLDSSKDFVKDKGVELLPEVIDNEYLLAGAEIVGGAMVDLVPVVGKVAANHYMRKRIKNTETLMSELNQRMVEIETALKTKTPEEKEVLDDLMAYVYEQAMETQQKDKISYMVNGFTNLTKVEQPSTDITYIYYDTLSQLTVLDISVLKLYGRFYVEVDSATNYSEVLEEFGIEYHQYDAVRKNLQRMSLLEDAEEESFDKHFKDFVKVFNQNMKILTSLKNLSKFNPRDFGRLKNIKEYRPRERLRISKFGREFLRFFVEENN
ncbi:hypothetical protein ACI1UE_10595 [Lactococcus petauri]|uniref:hypothetical protein n=1 Tax=Lactococcus petauri TaxID=1940789 RepID=UPI003248C471